MEADTLTHVGDTYQTVGQARAARDAWQQALTLFDELDHPDGEHIRGKLARSTYPLTPPEDR